VTSRAPSRARRADPSSRRVRDGTPPAHRARDRSTWAGARESIARWTATQGVRGEAPPSGDAPAARSSVSSDGA
jgi:hypothetical protein